MLKTLRLLFVAAAILFLMAPLVAIVPLAFTSSEVLSYPLPGASLRWFREIFTVDTWSQSIVNALLISSGTTILATILGCAAALGLRERIAFERTIRMFLLLPMVVPAVVLGVGMQLVFARLGIGSTYVGTIVAHTVIAVPFVVVCVSSALKGLDRRLGHAGLSLGASPLAVFGFVTLPLIMPGVVSGAVLAFATSLDEVVLTLFVAGPNQRTLARQMFSTLRDNVSPAIAAAAVLFIAVTILLGLLLWALRRSRPALET
jgi:putative spermidine/putrescine transport system permease protein